MMWWVKAENFKNAGHRVPIYKVLFEILLVNLILGLIIVYTPPVACAVENSETAYRIKPLQDKLASMDASEINSYVNKYPDMRKHWSRQVVGKLTGLDIIGGVDGKFLPDSTVQADQFVKMAVRTMGYKIEQGKGYWAQPYIDTALKEGIILKGEIKDYKKPLLREQMARIIVRTALKVDEKPDDRYDQYIIGKVLDYISITDGIKQFVLDSYKLGLITGTNNKFNPKGTMTRAEASAVIIRFLDTTERKPMKPGPDEILKLNDSLGNPTEIYPGSIPELFTVAKAAQDAIPKAKGYVHYFIGSDGKYVCAKLYKDKDSYNESIYNMIAAFDIAYNRKEASFAYILQVWDDEAYEKYFPEYTREILKKIYEADAKMALTLHDKYMSMQYTREDGLNEFTIIKLNNRNTRYLRYDSNQFAIQIKLKGLK